MSDQFCPNCGKSVPYGAKFCEGCGYSLTTSKTTQTEPVQQDPQQPPIYKQQPPQYQQQGQYPPPQSGFMNRFQKPPDYIRPPNYVETTTMSQRIIGTSKFNVHVVEEIEGRPDLQDEAQRLLFVSLAIITVFEIITIFSLPEIYLVHSEIGTIVEKILVSFVGGYVFIYLLATIGKFIGGSATTTSTSEMMRILSYSYVLRAISQVLIVVSIITANDLLFLVWIIVTLYSFLVFIFVIRRGLDRGYPIAILVIIITLFVNGIYVLLIGNLMEQIYDLTFEVIEQP